MLEQEITARWPWLKLKEEIGHGAYGRVYKVLNTECAPPMEEALKVISIPLAEDEGEMDNTFYRSAAETLAREATILSDLSGNPYIVRYYDHAIIPHDSGVGYDILIRMELLTPFKRHVAERGLLRQDVIKVGIDICRALELCRKRGVIHRDIKPENIFISDAGNYKLGDFGVAVNVDKTLGGLSKKGTYSYMAPEVYKGADYGPSIDIYSLGMILYRLLNNDRDPFVPSARDSVLTFDDTQRALSRRMRGEALPCPVNEGGPLWDIVKKAASPLPEDRYRAPEEMRAELELLVDKGDTALLRLPGRGPEPETGSRTATQYSVEPQTERVQQNTAGGKWVCPRCGRTNGPKMLCPGCGFDGSTNYLAYPTLEAPDGELEPVQPKDADNDQWTETAVCNSTESCHITAEAEGCSQKSQFAERSEEKTEEDAPPTGNDVETQRPQGKKKGLLFAGVAVLLLSVALIAFSGSANSDTGGTGTASSTAVAAEADDGDTTTATPSGSVMGDVGSYDDINIGSGLSLDGVTAKKDITEVYFLDTLADAPADAADLSEAGDRSVLCWTEGSTQYIAGEGGVAGGSSCAHLFDGYINVTAIHFSGCFDTSSVTNMSDMFSCCTDLAELDLSGWDTSRVTDMSSMFSICYVLTALDLSGWDTSSVTDMSLMFYSCDALTSLDLSGWDTSSVTDMGWMFWFCEALTSLDLSGWDTSSVTDMSRMFSDCYVLTALDLSGWDTSHVTNMYEMFYDCSSLTNFDPEWLDTSNADTTDMYTGTKWE